jgi:hypothetical protein
MKFSRYIIFGILVAGALSVASCKKSPEYVPEPYRCDCGTINWYGSPFDLLNTSFILSDSTEIASRRYYVTGKVSPPNQTLVNELNLILDVDDITLTALAKDSVNSDFSGLAQMLGVDNEFAVSYPYRVTEGHLSISPALLGGPETVNFNLKLDPLFGNASDPVIPVSGSFTVQVPY